MAKLLYDEMSWLEVKEAAEQQRVPLIPVGSTEQHGPHLPTKTDAFLAYEVCKEAARRATEAVVLPPVSYGYNEHHLDFPATIHIGYETLTKFVIDIGKSLAHHGFQRIIIVNGHGSNTAPMEIAARRITLESTAICASLIYIALAPEALTVLEAEDAHAAELETSLMLHMAPELVDMTKAVRDWGFPKSKFIQWGYEPGQKGFGVAGGTVQFMDWWSRMSETGTLGDPTKASREKGKRILHLCTEALANFIREFKNREIKPRTDHH